MRVTDKYVFFWGGELSNFHPCSIEFVYNKQTIKCISSEQFLMYWKAITFNDHETADLILKAETPKEAKKLGRKVKDFNDDTWNLKKEDVMRAALYKKFTQNKELRDFLLNPEFDGKTFVEASPYDKIWGVGLEETDPLIDDEKNWKGQNLLGKWMNWVREIIKIENENLNNELSNKTW
jgi:ribA/ribD-fused uncharacterized protein